MKSKINAKAKFSAILCAIILSMPAQTILAADAPAENSAVSEVQYETSMPSPVSTPSTSINTTESNITTQSDFDAESMERALTAVKKLFEIDEKVYTEFDYSYYDSYYSGRLPYQSNERIWQFSWSSPNSDYRKSISASASDTGVVLNFSKYEYTGDRVMKFADVSQSDAIKKAEEFLKLIYPSTYKDFKSTSSYTYLESDTYSISFSPEINGYMFNDIYVSVTVNKFTGEITGMYRSNLDIENYTFSFSENFVNKEDAIKLFAEHLGFELKYTSYYDYETKQLKVFPIYTLKESNKYIDAVTGKIVTIDYNYITADSRASVMGYYAETEKITANDAGSGVYISPAEQVAIDSVKDVISSSKAISSVCKIAGIDTTAVTSQSINLSKNNINENQYLWQIYLGGDTFSLNATVDAKKGDIISYYFYDYNEKTQGIKAEEKLSEKELNKIALEQLNALCSKDLSQFVESKPNYVTPYNAETSTSYSLYYVRQENGIPFDSNSVSISINAVTGKITNYNLSWYENVTFPSIKNVVSVKHALDEIQKSIDYKTKYINSLNYDEKTQKWDVALVYDFESPFGYVDAYTGKFLNYNGVPYEENEYLEPDYTDLTDPWLESIVTKLTENGVNLWGGRFEANKALSEKEFYTYISNILGNVYIPYKYQEIMYNNKENLSNEAIQRKDALKIVCELLGYDKLAEQSEVFIAPFSNSINNEYKGYVAICKALNLIIADDYHNTYNIEKNFTREDIVIMIYNYILKQQ